MTLDKYKTKRNFKETPEPESHSKKNDGNLIFVIQRHQASRLHYDLRLEMEGVLKSWAVPKGPSLNPKDKRLAMMVEDHPFDYKDFEGVIPEGNYGAGIVEIWDKGVYNSLKSKNRKEAEKELLKGLEKGDLKFSLSGEKVKGEFALVKIKKDNDNSANDNSWLLIKKKDEFAVDEDYNSEDFVDPTSEINKKLASKEKNKKPKKSNTSKSKSDFKKGKIIPGNAPKGSLPRNVKPMLAKLFDQPFDDPDFIFEIKWDGYRAITEIEKGKVSMYSRNGLSFYEKYPTLIEILSQLSDNVVLDGEVVVLDENGHSHFQLLQNFKSEYSQNLCYYVFDILHLNGYNLTDLTLLERKKYISQVIEDLPNILYSDHIVENGNLFFQEAQKSNLEGIIAKKANSPYRVGKRSNEWLKIKTSMRQEAVICGFTEPKGGRKHFGSLVLGVYEQGKFRYIGHSGGGFNDKSLKETKEKLEPLIQKESPFKEKIKTNAPVTWVKPELVCEVAFSEWTGDYILRHPIFQGFREDKDPKEVVIEKPDLKKEKSGNNSTEKSSAKSKKAKAEKDTNNPSPGSKSAQNKVDMSAKGSKTKNKNLKEKPEKIKKTTDNEKSKADSKIDKDKKGSKSKEVEELGSVIKKIKNSNKAKEEVEINGYPLTLSNLKKIYWPEEKYTKGDLIEYYSIVSQYILPYLKDRPESLHRHPNGINNQSFFHKDMSSKLPEWIETVVIRSESNNKDINYLVCQNEASLIYMNNLGCIEINPWNSRKQSLDNPDYIVIDLDPADNTFEEVIETALVVKSILDKAGAESYIKTSGASGMHIYIPLGAKYDYEQGRNFAHIIAQLANAELPDLTSIERSPKSRPKSIYLDYLQNRMGQTLASVYSVRPKPGATVSTPLEWKEVKKGLHPSQFTIKTLPKRLKKTGDIFKGVLGKGIDMEKCLVKLGG